jgi:hypothetical protein
LNSTRVCLLMSDESGRRGLKSFHTFAFSLKILCEISRSFLNFLTRTLFQNLIFYPLFSCLQTHLQISTPTDLPPTKLPVMGLSNFVGFLIAFI